MDNFFRVYDSLSYPYSHLFLSSEHPTREEAEIEATKKRAAYKLSKGQWLVVVIEIRPGDHHST